MQIKRFHSPLARLMAGLTFVGSTALLLTGVLVAPAGAVTGPPFASKVTVTASPGSLVTGQSATFTAKVGSTGHPTPGGQAVFTITGADSSVLHCDAGDTAILASGTAGCTVSSGLNAASGPYTVQAAYTDTVDSNYKPSSGFRNQVVTVGNTTTVLSSSMNPSVTGEGISINAAVTAVSPAVGNPTGSVTFTGVTCDGGSNTIPLAVGMAQCQIVGGLISKKSGYSVSGSFSGSPQFGASSGKLKQSVVPAGATVTLVPSVGSCSGDVCTVVQGIPLSFVATAAASGSDGGTGTPTGTITFAITKPGSNSSLSCDGGTNALVLNGAGQATCTITSGIPAIVYYKVTASLVSPTYAPSVATLFENAALWSTNVTTSVPKDVGAGQSIDVTAVVAPTAGYNGSSTPTGYVNILVCGSNSNGSNGCQGGAVPLDPTGTAKLTLGGGEFPGAYFVQAVYTGDGNFYTSAAKRIGLGVGLSDTQVSLSEPGGFYSADGDPVAITATVSTPNGAAGSTLVGPPTGNVTFTITGPGGQVTCAGGNSIALASGPGQVEGSVTCYLPAGTLTTSPLTTTSYTVSAKYSGDFDFHFSSGNATQVVTPLAV